MIVVVMMVLLSYSALCRMFDCFATTNFLPLCQFVKDLRINPLLPYEFTKIAEVIVSLFKARHIILCVMRNRCVEA